MIPWRLAAMILMVFPIVASAANLYFLSYSWSDVPANAATPGTLYVELYLDASAQLGGLEIIFEPKCGFLNLTGVSLGVVKGGPITVSSKVSSTRTGTTCEVDVVAKWKFEIVGGLVRSVSWPDNTARTTFTLYVPRVPQVYVNGEGMGHIGVPSEVYVDVSSNMFPVSMTIAVDGARLLSPIGEVTLWANSTVPVTVVPMGRWFAVSVTVRAVDELGNVYTRTYTMTFPADEVERPFVSVNRDYLVAETWNALNLSILAPGGADGTAYVRVENGLVRTTPLYVSIVGGRGSGRVEVLPLASPVILTVDVQYRINGSTLSETHALSLPVYPKTWDLGLSVRATPDKLIGGMLNNVTLTLERMGPFKAVIDVSGGALRGEASPITVESMGGPVARRLQIYPTSSNVVLSLSVEAPVDGLSRNVTARYTVVLPVIGGNLFAVSISPSILKAGGEREVTLELINMGDVAVRRGIVVVSSDPSSPIQVGTRVFTIGRLEPLEGIRLKVNASVPVTAEGTAPLRYEISYITELGSTGRESGTVSLTVVQTARLLIADLSHIPERPENGSVTYISVTLVNAGYSDVSNAVFEVEAPPGLVPFRISQQYIGVIGAQQQTSASIPVMPTAPGTYNVTVRIRFIDKYGVEHVIDRSLTLNVAPRKAAAPESPRPLPWLVPVLLLGVIMVAASLAIIAMRRRRR